MLLTFRQLSTRPRFRGRQTNHGNGDSAGQNLPDHVAQSGRKNQTDKSASFLCLIAIFSATIWVKSNNSDGVVVSGQAFYMLEPVTISPGNQVRPFSDGPGKSTTIRLLDFWILRRRRGTRSVDALSGFRMVPPMGFCSRARVPATLGRRRSRHRLSFVSSSLPICSAHLLPQPRYMPHSLGSGGSPCPNHLGSTGLPRKPGYRLLPGKSRTFQGCVVFICQCGPSAAVLN